VVLEELHNNSTGLSNGYFVGNAEDVGCEQDSVYEADNVPIAEVVILEPGLIVVLESQLEGTVAASRVHLVAVLRELCFEYRR